MPRVVAPPPGAALPPVVAPLSSGPDPLDEFLEGGAGEPDPLDQFLAKKPDPLDEIMGAAKVSSPVAPSLPVTPPPAAVPPSAAAAPVAPSPHRPKKGGSGDLLANLPPELSGLIVSEVGNRPPPRPVLWGQNLEADRAADLNLEFVSTEKEIIDNFDDVPMITLSIDEDTSSSEPKKKKKNPDDES